MTNICCCYLQLKSTQISMYLRNVVFNCYPGVIEYAASSRIIKIRVTECYYNVGEILQHLYFKLRYILDIVIIPGTLDFGQIITMSNILHIISLTITNYHCQPLRLLALCGLRMLRVR